MLTEKEKEILNLLIREAPNYNTYPAQVEKRIYKRISRAGARLACERLVKAGILQSIKKRSQTWSKSTPHYRLPENKDTFVKIVQEYFRTLAKSNPFSWQSSAMFFMGSAYARRHITANLVREVLSSRKVEIRELVEMKRNQETEPRQRFNHIILSFPVIPVGGQVTDIESKVTNYSGKTSADEKVFVQDAIRDHYSKEESVLIMPILALIEISPTALEFFLGNWEPYDNDGTISISGESQGFEMIEHVLFRLIWGAVSDLSLRRNVPENEHVLGAYVSGGLFSRGKQPLLRLSCRNHLSIEYEAGFDTDEILYGGEDGAPVVVENNPENCTVRMTVTPMNAMGRPLPDSDSK